MKDALTPAPWKYGVRKDGSIWMSLGNPETGPHRQFDWHGTEKDAAFTVAAHAMYEALIQARGALRLDVMREDNGDYFGTTKVALEAIDAALAAAKGESP